MNVLEEYIKFEKNNITSFVREVLTDEFFDEEIFNKYLESYVNVRYYGYYVDNTKELKDFICIELNKITSKLIDGESEEGLNKINAIAQVFNLIMVYDGVLEENEKKYISDICNYRIKLFGSCDMLFKENINKMILQTKKKRKDYFNFFKSDNFYINRKETSNEHVFKVVMKYKLDFPKLYSRYAIDRVFYNGTINEDRLPVLYYLVGNIIMKDINKCIYNNQYLIDFATSLFENKEKMESIMKVTESEAFKNQTVLMINYLDFAKYGNIIKDMIKEGYKFALVLEDEDISNDALIFELFEYILVPNGSSYCNRKSVNDKIIYEI